LDRCSLPAGIRRRSDIYLHPYDRLDDNVRNWRFWQSSLSVSNILPAQFSILVQALCALVLAALFAERRHHVINLLDNQTRLRAA
jgi:hypothetical protein